MRMIALVSGAAGFIQSAITRELRDRDAGVKLRFRAGDAADDA